MKIEELQIGDRVRYETYYSGVKINTFGIIDSALEQNYFKIKNLINNKQECHHHKDSVIAKVLEIGEDYQEVRIDTYIRRYNDDDNTILGIMLGDACNHCVKCGTSSMMGEYYVDSYLCHNCNGATNKELIKEIKDRLNYFYKKTDETMEFPNSAAGDILKMVNKLLNK